MDIQKLKLSDVLGERGDKSYGASGNMSNKGSLWIKVGNSKWLVYEGKINFSNEENDRISDKYGWEAYEKRNLLENRWLIS